jgi:putative tributyrin esterase
VGRRARARGIGQTPIVIVDSAIVRFMKAFRLSCLLLLTVILFVVIGCQKKQDAPPDHPRLTANVSLRDVTFHSAALNRAMLYRVIMPLHIAGEARLPVVYLLHGAGGNFRDWSNYSDVTGFAEQGLILVMPEGDDSYYANSIERPRDRYEDYIASDLIADVESRFPASPDRAHRAVVGVSMGGYGAIKMALSHPEMFAFAGGLSSAVDVPSRPFSIKRISQWRYHRSIFGPWGSAERRNRDPFVLARSADPARTPYLFLTCGDREGLLPANRNFAVLLDQRHFRFEFHVVRGGHDWNQWNAQLATCFQKLLAVVNQKT